MGKGLKTLANLIGFACKMLTEQTFSNKKSAGDWLKSHNTSTTTVANLDRLTRTQAIDKIVGLINHNSEVLCRQFALLGAGPAHLRMMRIGSEIMPARTHPRYMSWYEDEPEIRRALGSLAKAGEVARQFDIRLSTHPGQFTLLCSNSEEAVSRSIDDLHYHSEIFRLMGFDSTDQRQEINIHGGAAREDFVEQFSRNWRRLPRDTQQWLSVENDEFSYCLDQLLPLADKVKICVDINHYWIYQGDYLDPNDPRLATVVDSWRGARPEMHVAYPQESLLAGHDPLTLPNMALLESQGYRRSKLRAHSETAWLTAISHYAGQFWDRFDLMVEAKSKNLAAQQLAQTLLNPVDTTANQA
jgi:UV DNA damage repair endonuclease